MNQQPTVCVCVCVYERAHTPVNIYKLVCIVYISPFSFTIAQYYSVGLVFRLNRLLTILPNARARFHAKFDSKDDPIDFSQ